MADIVNRTNSRNDELIREIAQLIDDHKGQDTLALYIGDISSWTDYFVVSTAQSTGHMNGLLRWIKEFLSEKGIEPLRRQKASVNDDDGWILIDCGVFVIHLMREETREFYELERLWFSGEVLYGEV